MQITEIRYLSGVMFAWVFLTFYFTLYSLTNLGNISKALTVLEPLHGLYTYIIFSVLLTTLSAVSYKNIWWVASLSFYTFVIMYVSLATFYLVETIDLTMYANFSSYFYLIGIILLFAMINLKALSKRKIDYFLLFLLMLVFTIAIMMSGIYLYSYLPYISYARASFIFALSAVLTVIMIVQTIQKIFNPKEHS